MAIMWLLVAAVPIGVSLWALLDAARRPAWAWSLAERSQLAWLTAIIFSLFLSFVGLAVATWYLVRVRASVAAVERGDLTGVEPSGEPPDIG